MARPCPRCGGCGTIAFYGHVENGCCFRCGGSGMDPETPGFFPPGALYQEKTVAGSKIVLAASKDLGGRFLGYMVFVAGQPGCATFHKYSQAKAAFVELVRRKTAEKNAQRRW